MNSCFTQVADMVQLKSYAGKNIFAATAAIPAPSRKKSSIAPACLERPGNKNLSTVPSRMKSRCSKSAVGQTLFLLLFMFILAQLAFICDPKDAYASEGRSLSEVFGVTREELVSWLESHEQDSYYLGTPYRPYDWRSPTGDINHWGSASDGISAGMNCTGFVWHALCAAKGWSNDIANRLPSLQGWAQCIKNENLLMYSYSSKEAMLSDGRLEKGDIIWMFDQTAGGMAALSDFHHVGIFWGETASDDKLWHSVADDSISWTGSNRISEIHGKAASVLYTIIKIKPEGGYLELLKESADPAVSKNNVCYSIEGAEYDIFNEEGTWISSLITNSDGWAQSIRLAAGKYKVKERKAPSGYALDAAEYLLEILPGQTVRVNQSAEGVVYEQPFSSPVSLLLEKVDSATGKNVAQGRASLANAEFKVSYYTDYYSSSDTAWIEKTTPARSWIVRTDDQGKAFLEESYKLSGDAFYYNKSGAIVLPLGTVTIQEIKAPPGYVLDDQSIHVQHIQYNKELNTIVPYKTPAIKEQVIRGDLAFVKIEEKTMKRLAGVPFEIKSNTTGETHVIVTDENGSFNTSSKWNLHSQNTNRGESSEDGIWFGLASDGLAVSVDDSLGALPYDSYTIKELPCKANAGKFLPTFELVIERNMTIINLGTITNELEVSVEPPAQTTENEKPVMPKTGDAVTIITCVVLGIACIAGISLLILLKKRSRKDYRQFPLE